MSVRKKPYPGEMIHVNRGHKVEEASEDLITIEVTRFKKDEPVGTGRINIPIGYLEYNKDLNTFFLKKEYLDWFNDEGHKIGYW